MRWVSIVGARPQFVKIAPVCRAIAAHNRAGGAVEDFIVHTGQHYDAAMSAVFFEELGIPRAAVDLGVGSGSHGVQTARMLEGIEGILLEKRPELVIVYGDTNSTVAGALAAAKLHVPIAHVEAGLRSFNRRMPEEVNRIATDHLADVLLAPTPTAMQNLAREGLAGRSHRVGDVMYDAVLYNRDLADRGSKILDRLGLEPESYGVVTVHRAESTGPSELADLVATLGEIARTRLPLVFPVHPRTRKVLESQGWQASPQLQLVEPLGYLDMLRLVGASRLALTDSGGLQKEAFILGRPCVTLRTETEWIETVDAGANIIAGLSRDAILRAVDRWLAADRATLAGFQGRASETYGGGQAAAEIVGLLTEYIRARNSGKSHGGGTA